jgi:benzoyl-CoA reductase/2-hydroxyglutaryl-CoA dehydratase subunit BcrC/BadD/HgdB
MAPIAVLRGTREAVSFYEKLLAEVEERVARGEGAIEDEKHRLLWDNIPIWHRLYRLFGRFAEFGACFVVDTYTNAWSGTVELDEPIEGLAKVYTGIYTNIGIQARAKVIIELIEGFGVDGCVFHSNRSCKPFSLGQYVLKRIVSERTGKPVLIIEADMCDERAYSEMPIKARIEAFVERLKN